MSADRPAACSAPAFEWRYRKNPDKAALAGNAL
jgi:hypothetical protein